MVAQDDEIHESGPEAAAAAGSPDGLRRLFEAHSVAVVGASKDPDKWGYQVVRSILGGGFGGAVYPVNPRGGEILGLPVYERLRNLPEPPDVVVVSLPATFVPAVIDEAAQAGAGVLIVLAKGFREAGNAGLQDDMVAALGRHGLRLVGPNVMGLTFLPLRLNTMPWPCIDVAGPLGVIGQSGTVTAALAEWAADDGLGVSAILNTGNQADVCEVDFLEALDAEPSTRAIALHVEGLHDGRRFLETLRALRKPVAVLKSGRSTSGRRAAASHTGSLAGRDEVFTGVCRQVGAIRAATLSDLYDSAKALATLGHSRGDRVLFLSTSGGSGALAVDDAERRGLTVAQLPEGFIESLRELGLAPASSANPLDLDTESAADFETAGQLAIDRDVADYIVLGFGDPIPGAARVAARLAPQLPGGIVSYYLAGGDVQRAESLAMHEAGIPVFPTPERAAHGIASCVHWTRAYRRRFADAEARMRAGK